MVSKICLVLVISGYTKGWEESTEDRAGPKSYITSLPSAEISHKGDGNVVMLAAMYQTINLLLVKKKN